MQWIITLLFTAGALFLLFEAMTINTSSHKRNAVLWLPVMIVAVMSFHAFAAGVINLVSVPVNALSVGLADLAVGGTLCFLKRKKGRQKFEWEITDAIFLAVLVIILCVFVNKRFGADLNVNFQSVDGAVHYRLARQIFRADKLYNTNMYFSALNTALLMDVARPFLQDFEMYKVYVLAESVNLLLSGWIFYTVIRSFCKNRQHMVLAASVAVLYLYGYPMYSTIFGFSYFGMAITVIAYILFMTDTYIREEMDVRSNICFLLLGCFGLFVCYTMFIPVVYLGVFTAVAIKIYREKKLFSLYFIKTMLGIFLIPCILGLAYSVSNLTALQPGASGGTAAIAVEGGCYRDLYSNFIWLVPLLAVGIAQTIKSKRLLAYISSVAYLIIFMLILFFYGMKGKVSSYYFCKNHNLLWLLFFIGAFAGLVSLYEKERTLVVALYMTVIFLFLAAFGSIDQYVIEHNQNFISVTASNFLNIYTFNREWRMTTPYDAGKEQLYQHVCDAFKKDGESVLVAADENDDAWYQAFTDQEFAICNGSMDIFQALLESQDASYVCVLYSSGMFAANPDYFTALNRVYENEAGFVAELPK